MVAWNDFVDDLRQRTNDIRTQRLIADIRYWRERAEEIRTEAGFTVEPMARATLLDNANGYELLAVRIEERLARTVNTVKATG
jgi:hypothetical protein